MLKAAKYRRNAGSAKAIQSTADFPLMQKLNVSDEISYLVAKSELRHARYFQGAVSLIGVTDSPQGSVFSRGELILTVEQTNGSNVELAVRGQIHSGARYRGFRSWLAQSTIGPPLGRLSSTFQRCHHRSSKIYGPRRLLQTAWRFPRRYRRRDSEGLP